MAITSEHLRVPARPPLASLLAGADLALCLLAGALWYVRPGLASWPLALVAAGLLAYTLAGGQGRSTPLDVPLLLLLLAAGLGLLIAYDQPAALAKFFQIVGGVFVFDALARAPEWVRTGRLQVSPVRLFLAVLPAAFAVYFLLTTDWPQWMGKLSALDPLRSWVSARQPQVPGHRLHPNIVAGAMAAFLPLQLAALWPLWSRRGSWALALLRTVGFLVLILCSLFGLLLSASRGAWAGLAAGLMLWACWRVVRSHWPGLAARRGLLLALLVVGFLAGLAVIVLLAGSLDMTGRSQLLRDSLALALDYPFTGFGLAGFPLVHTSYAHLMHVAVQNHSHNLLLDLWLETGPLGLAAWLALLSAGFYLGLGQRTAFVGNPKVQPGSDRFDPYSTSGKLPGIRAWSAPALAALTVIAVHGLVDDAFFGSRGVLLLFLPAAVIIRDWRESHGQSYATGWDYRARAERPSGTIRTRDAGKSRGPISRVATPALVLLGCVALLSLLLLSPVRAAWQANLGALAQTRAELSVYRWPDWPIQDALRVSGSIDLAPAVARYNAALALDAGNVTANRRLGQIELSLGQYDAALRHLQAAYAVAPGQRATRQLLGEAYAVAGDLDAARALWRTVDVSNGQLGAREWWYNHVGDKQTAGEFARAAAAMGPQPRTSAP